MYKGICLNGHTGSVNRGCEAIIKSTAKIFNDIGVDVCLSTHDAVRDKEFGLKEFKKVYEYTPLQEIKRKNFLKYVYVEIQDKIFKNKHPIYKVIQENIIKNMNDWVSLNVGGDTYCYKNNIPYISYALNEYARKKRLPNIFWGCSIEEKYVNKMMIDDLKKYTMIFPRETLTYNTLRKLGIPEEKLFLMCDPAFNLDLEEIKLPDQFYNASDIIGINISPLIINSTGSKDLIWDNIFSVIDYILEKSNATIALIPHVYIGKNKEDLETLNRIYSKYKDTNRVILFNQFYNCKQLKYIISKTKILITARTHASIAGYSTCVPTLVLGYSVKSKGIAKDLFGDYKNYVVSVQEIKEKDELLRAYQYIEKECDKIKENLKKIMPEYKKKAYIAAEKVKKIVEEKKSENQ